MICCQQDSGSWQVGGEELIEAAQKEKPDLIHLDYNLGRAEALPGNDSEAAGHSERAVKIDRDPEVVEQAWFSVGHSLSAAASHG